MNDRVLATAGYFYSFNSLFLTLRVFGNITQQLRSLGVIELALLGIIKDLGTIILQFVAAILAFSIAITKVYMAEKSFIANGSARNNITCNNSGISCWWVMVGHLGWTLLGEPSTSDPLASVDASSEHIARILYATFLVFAVILLLNMLIALLTNTYQQTEDNSFKVWLIKRVITIQTSDEYDPVPVPFNIIYNIGKLLWLVPRKCKGTDESEETRKYFKDPKYKEVIEALEVKYFAKRANFLPVTDGFKVDRVLNETEKNGRMVSQILFNNTSFQSQGGNQGMLYANPEMWKVNPSIEVDASRLTCECRKQCAEPDCLHGARYRKELSQEFAHFEVVILETGKKRWLGIGVVHENEHYDDMKKMPGCHIGSVGYHTDGGQIFHQSSGKETKGNEMARRGDRIGCKVMFKDKKLQDGKEKVPVLFFLNGKKIITEEKDPFLIDIDEPLYPYICMTDGVTVLTKMCPREVEDLESKLTKCLEKTNQKLGSLEELVKYVDKKNEETNQKLGALLASLADIKKDLQYSETNTKF